MKKIVLLLASILIVELCDAQNASFNYLGQTPPSDNPVVFAPGVISLPNRNEAVITISPDGKLIFFHIQFFPNPGRPFTMFTKYVNGKWTTPDTAVFAKNRATGEPIFAFNGSRLYMFATGAINQVGAPDLSYVEIKDEIGTTPISLGNPPNLPKQDQYHPCIVSDSSVFFVSSAGEICRAEFKNGAYLEREVLPFPVNNANTTQTWGDPYVSPNEEYMIFKSTRVGGYGQNDLYITYKKSVGSWTNPKNLGSKINTAGDEKSGDITHDGKFMTFGRDGDIYWVSASFVDSMKNTNYIPYVKMQLQDQSLERGASFNYKISDFAFIDDDGNNTLTLTATLENGAPLPSWLKYNAITKTFRGNPTSVGKFAIKITATDTHKASVSSSFTITVGDKK